MRKLALGWMGLALVAVLIYVPLFGIAAGMDMSTTVILSWIAAGLVAGFPSSAVAWLVIAIAVTSFGLLLAGRPRTARSRFPKRTAIVLVLAAPGAGAVLLTDIPRDLAFLASKAAFEASLAEAPGRPMALDEDIGLYLVTDWARDERGGTFFVIDHAGGGVFKLWNPDVGFAHRPNAHGTPFGDDVREMESLGGDWYYFELANE